VLLYLLIAVNHGAVTFLSFALKFGVNSLNPLSVHCVLFARTKVVCSFSFHKKGCGRSLGVGRLLDSLRVCPARFTT
jgi:hypothetical protein